MTMIASYVAMYLHGIIFAASGFYYQYYNYGYKYCLPLNECCGLHLFFCSQTQMPPGAIKEGWLCLIG